MKAIILTQYGSPEDLRLQEVAQPMPEDDAVLIRVKATSVNDWDWSLVIGRPFYIRLFCGLFKPNVQIPGADVAGEVIAIGEKVTQFQPGDRVYGDLSEQDFGGFAEYVCAPERALTPMPDTMSYEAAAAIPHAALLALQGLRDLGKLKPGQSVLINGAGGGVGTLGVQIAKALGAEHVTGVDSAEKSDAMKSAGFDSTIDYRQEDFTASAERYDLILDAKTTRSIVSYLRVLNPHGTYVTVGGKTAYLLTFLLSPIIRFFTKKNLRVLGLKTNRGLSDINMLYESGYIKPVLDGPYRLRDTVTAIRRFGKAEHKGKVIITL